MGGNKISASGVSPKWVKSNERRKRERKKKERKRERKSMSKWSVYTPEPTLIFSRSYSTEITVQG